MGIISVRIDRGKMQDSEGQKPLAFAVALKRTIEIHRITQSKLVAAIQSMHESGTSLSSLSGFLRLADPEATKSLGRSRGFTAVKMEEVLSALASMDQEALYTYLAILGQEIVLDVARKESGQDFPRIDLRAYAPESEIARLVESQLGDRNPNELSQEWKKKCNITISSAEIMQILEQQEPLPAWLLARLTKVLKKPNSNEEEYSIVELQTIHDYWIKAAADIAEADLDHRKGGRQRETRYLP